MVNGRCVFTVTKLTYADKPPSGTGTLSGTYLVLEVPLESAFQHPFARLWAHELFERHCRSSCGRRRKRHAPAEAAPSRSGSHQRHEGERGGRQTLWLGKGLTGPPPLGWSWAARVNHRLLARDYSRQLPCMCSRRCFWRCHWQVTWRQPPRSQADRAARGSLGPRSRTDS